MGAPFAVYYSVQMCARECVCVFEVKAVELMHGSAVLAEGFLLLVFLFLVHVQS